MVTLYQAVAKNDLNAVKAAFASGCDDASGALANAAETGALSVVEFLTKQGVRHDWAIVNAARFGHLRIVRFLLKNSEGDTDAAFISAAAHGQTNVMKYFLKTLKNPPLDEALADAVLRGYADIVRMLMTAGANPRASVYDGRTAEKIAANKNDPKIVSLLK